MNSTSPTQRSLKWCRAQGWSAAVVEKWNPHANVRQDLFGCIDIVALNDVQGVLGVQATSATNASSRIAKIADNTDALRWLLNGNGIEVHGWRKNAKGRIVLNRWAMLPDGFKIKAVRVGDDA